MDIPQILERLRLLKNLSQQNIADEIGVDLSTYIRYEKGKTEPKLSQVKKLADFYNLSLDGFYNFGSYSESIEQNMVKEPELTYGKKVSVMVELDGTKKTEEHWQLLIKEINELLSKKLNVA